MQPDTRQRFLDETTTELLTQRIHQAIGDYDRMRRDLENARKTLAGFPGIVDKIKAFIEREAIGK